MILNSSELRNRTKSKRQSCYICGSHERISESHHLISLSSARIYINAGLENDIELKLKLPKIWLCPNHHSYLHYFQKKQKRYLLGIYLFYEATLSELSAYIQLLQMTIKWLEVASNRLIYLWSKEGMNENAFRTVYRSICHDLNDWKSKYKYLSQIVEMRVGEKSE